MNAPRRDAERPGDRGESERDPNAYRKGPQRPSEPSRRPQLNEYWIDGEGINRQVLQMEICKYLGNEATSRPGDYKGTPGFKIRALRPFTPDMLDDLRSMSKSFRQENATYQKRHDRDLPYEASQTYENSNTNTTQEDFRDRNVYSRGSPSYNGPSPYPPASQSGYPVSSAPYVGTSTYAVNPGIPASSPMAPDARYAPPSSNYGNGYPMPGHEGGDHRDPRNNNQFGQYPNQYPPGPYGNEPYRGPDPRGADPRMNQPDYYGNGQYPPNGRGDARMNEGYYDQMQGVNGPGGYPPQQGRGAMPSQYDNPGRQDPYRTNPRDQGNYRR